jgi:hypothetical protein
MDGGSIALSGLAVLIWIAPVVGVAVLVRALISGLEWKTRLVYACAGVLLLGVWVLLDLTVASLV